MALRGNKEVEMGSPGERHTTTTGDSRPDQRIRALLKNGEETSCVELSEIGQLAEELDLPDSAVEDVLDEIEARGI